MLMQQIKEFSKCGQSNIIKSAGRNEKHEKVVEKQTQAVETLLCEFTFLATFLHLRKQREQILTIGPSPVRGPEHWRSAELAPALE